MFAGNDSNGTPMYVGRAHHSGDLVPGKVLSNNNCHIPYDGKEHAVTSFEVLINNNYQWVPSSDGQVPHNAIVGGRTSSGEQLYIGRVAHCGVTTPGKIHPSHRCIYIPFGWKEHRYTHYEVLVNNNNSGCCPPPVQPPPCQPIHPPVCPPVQPPISICPPHRPPSHFPPMPPFPGRGGHHHHHHHHHHHPPHHRKKSPHRKC